MRVCNCATQFAYRALAMSGTATTEYHDLSDATRHTYRRVVYDVRLRNELSSVTVTYGPERIASELRVTFPAVRRARPSSARGG